MPHLHIRASGEANSEANDERTNHMLRYGRVDNLFYAEENFIKISPVHWKHFLVFSGSSVRADLQI